MRWMTIGAVMFVLGAVVTVSAGQTRTIDRAFAEYDRVYAALTKDSLEGIAQAATALEPLATEVSGAAAGTAAAALAKAADLTEARERFAAVSEALVPKFLDAKIPGLVGFVCTMKNAKWVQRGETVSNPYFGTEMPTCGVPIKSGG